MFAYICGWIGMVLILSDYYFLANKYLDGQNILYHIINALGSLGLTVDLFQKKAWPTFVMQSIFILIALYTITRLLL